MSDTPSTAVWQVDALLHRPGSGVGFLRQAWHDNQAQEFGPWRFAPKPDPLEGQTQLLSNSDASMDAQALEVPSETSGHAAVLDSESARAALGLSEAEIEQKILQARDAAYQQGREDALREFQGELDSERTTLIQVAQALHDLQLDSGRLLEPLKKLSIHVAQELVRGELRIDSAVIQRLMNACIEALDQPATTTIVQVGHADMHRLRELSLPGVTLELDETLSEGSVRAKVADTQVQDLMEHRLSVIAQQLMGAPKP